MISPRSVCLAHQARKSGGCRQPRCLLSGCTALLNIAKSKTRTVEPTKLTVRTSAKAKIKTGRIHNEKTSVVFRPMRVLGADPRIGDCAHNDGGGPVADRGKLGRDS